eukprot:scaffold306600_cov19-Tisochrysis_lutea.AAC.3
MKTEWFYDGTLHEAHTVRRGHTGLRRALQRLLAAGELLPCKYTLCHQGVLCVQIGVPRLTTSFLAGANGPGTLVSGGSFPDK